MNILEETKLHSIIIGIQCLAYNLEEINNAYLLNSMSIILSDLADLTGDKTDRKKLLDFSKRIFESLKKQGVYNNIKV